MSFSIVWLLLGIRGGRIYKLMMGMYELVTICIQLSKRATISDQTGVVKFCNYILTL